MYNTNERFKIKDAMKIYFLSKVTVIKICKDFWIKRKIYKEDGKRSNKLIDKNHFDESFNKLYR